MGHALSTIENSPSGIERSFARPYLVGINVEEGLRIFLTDPTVCILFSSFIKGGTWLDHCRSYGNNAKNLCDVFSHEKVLAQKKMCAILEYQIPLIELKTLKPLVDGACSPSPGKQSLSGTKKDSNLHHEVFGDLYVDLEADICISIPQMVSILFAVLYPIFQKSPEYHRWMKYGGRMRALSEDEESNWSAGSNLPPNQVEADAATIAAAVADDCKRVEPDMQRQTTAYSEQRFGDLLTSAAAFYDEDVLIDYASAGNWVDDLLDTIEKLPVGLAVSCAVRPDHPVLFANKKFETITGYRRALLASSSLAVLRGARTEAEQAAIIDHAVEQGDPMKIGITLHRRNGAPFFCLTATQPVYSVRGTYKYFITVILDPHHDPTPDRVIWSIDDMMLLITRLLSHTDPYEATHDSEL